MPRTKQEILRDIRLLKANETSYNHTTVRADPYSLVAQRMVQKLPHTPIFEGMSFKAIRKYCKDPIMTAMYNSKAEPIKAFGEDTEELNAFYDTLNELFPGAMNVLEALNNRWDKTSKLHTWTTPDGHIAHVPVMVGINGHLDNEGLDLPYRFYENKPSTVGTSLAPNFVHSLDGFTVRHVRNNVDFDFMHIHDELKSHPNNMGKVRELYIDSFRIISESKVLEQYCEQDFNIDNRAFIAGLKDSSYALC